MKKTMLSLAVAASLGLASASASAAVFPDFQVTTTDWYTVSKTFTADKITGNYTEVITFNPNTGVFDVSILWEAGQFVQNDGNTPLSSSFTGLGATGGYGLYGLFTGTGAFAPSGSGFEFILTPGGALDVYIDKALDNETFWVAPSAGGGAFSNANSGEDVLLANGNALYGSGSLNTSCSGGINCGSFGQTTSFFLDINNFFTAPIPFYDLSFQSGQFNSFAVEGTQTINGSLDVVFGRVPEPASLALLGLGLLGLGMNRRRKA